MADKPSRLLINEQPLIVLPSLVKQFGINAAILLQQVHFRCAAAADNGYEPSFKEGEWWVDRTIDEWNAELFWLSRATVKRIVARLEEINLLVSRKFDATRGDHKKWYRIDYKVMGQYDHNDKLTETSSQNGSLRAVPDGVTESHSYIDQRVRRIAESLPSGVLAPEKKLRGNPWLARLYEACAIAGRFLEDGECDRYGANLKRLDARPEVNEQQMQAVVQVLSGRLIVGAKPSPQQIYGQLYGTSNEKKKGQDKDGAADPIDADAEFFNNGLRDL